MVHLEAQLAAISAENERLRKENGILRAAVAELNRYNEALTVDNNRLTSKFSAVRYVLNPPDWPVVDPDLTEVQRFIENYKPSDPEYPPPFTNLTHILDKLPAAVKAGYRFLDRPPNSWIDDFRGNVRPTEYAKLYQNDPLAVLPRGVMGSFRNQNELRDWLKMPNHGLKPGDIIMISGQLKTLLDLAGDFTNVRLDGQKTEE